MRTRHDFAAEVAAHLCGRAAELTGQWFTERFEQSIARGDTWLPPTVLGRHIPGFVRAVAGCLEGADLEAGRLPDALVAHDPVLALDEVEMFDTILFDAVRAHAVRRAPEVDLAEVLRVVERCHRCLTRLTRRVLNGYVDEMRRRSAVAADRSREVLEHVGHELRNRLQLATMVAEALESSDGDREQLVRGLHRTLRNIDAMAADVAGVHVASGSDSLVRRTALSVLVQETLEQIRIAAESAGVTLHVPERIPSLDVDAGRLELVLVNLISNAIKYRDPDKSLPWVRVGVADDGRGGLRVEVADNGIGVEPRHLTRIFDRSYRAEPARGRGDGLGLYLARRALRQIGSTLEVDSEPGRGTVFSFTLAFPDQKRTR